MCMKIQESLIDFYEITKKLGSGKFSEVWQAQHKLTKQIVALKIINVKSFNEEESVQLSTEIQCLKLLKNSTVLRLYEVLKTPTEIYLILEAGICDLNYYLQRYYSKKPMPELKAAQYFIQIVSAINHCHQKNIVHRDLKPENIVLFNNFQIVKIADFGLSLLIGEEKKSLLGGSLQYVAPEVLLALKCEPNSLDIWGLGIILYTLVCSAKPFPHLNENEMMVSIIDCKYQIPKFLSFECAHLLTNLLVKDPNERLSIEDILISDWLMLYDRYISPYKSYLIATISPELHMYVIRYMFYCGFKSYEAIIHSLLNESYDDIYATYYLIAESFVKDIFNLDYPIQLNLDISLFDLNKNYIDTFSVHHTEDAYKLIMYQEIKESMQNIIDNIPEPYYKKCEKQDIPFKKSKSIRHAKSFTNIALNETTSHLLPVKSSTKYSASRNNIYPITEYNPSKSVHLLSQRLSEMDLYCVPESPDKTTRYLSHMDVFENSSKESITEIDIGGISNAKIAELSENSIFTNHRDF